SATATATAARITEAYIMARHFRVGEREPLTRMKATPECPGHPTEYHSPVHSRAALRTPFAASYNASFGPTRGCASREKLTLSGPSNGEITDSRMANQANAQSGAHQRRCKDRVKRRTYRLGIFSNPIVFFTKKLA
ncbi:hypothetical protein ALC56_02332, partial [Trachymyrmex septentrionalis]